MARKIFVFISFALILGSAPSMAQATAERLFFNFESSTNNLNISTNHASYKRTNENGDARLVVNTGDQDPKPGVTLFNPKGNNWDLSGWYQIKADVSNLSSTPFQVEMFVGNDPDGLIRWYCSNYVDLEPGETKTITVDLSWSPWVFEPQLEVYGMRGVPGKIKTDLTKIDRFAFNVRYAKAKQQFSIDNIRAHGHTETRDTSGFFPFVDKYGQYKHKEWKGKIHSDKELIARSKNEIKALTQAEGPKNRNKYGGWTAGPKLKATGFFRTEKVDEKWWMVDPEGCLFWTAGVNCVSSGTGTTGTQYRENYFEEIPDTNGPYSELFGRSNRASHGFYKGKTPYSTFNFMGANLYKTYGKNWLSEFRDITHQRFTHWGLNTIGFMSDRELAAMHKTPYVGSVWIRGTPTIEGTSGFWGKFHDVFDPGFRQAVRSSMERQKFGAGDPWCIGFFVDNEMSWGKIGSLSLGTLKSPASQAAKQEFVGDLKKKYKSIEALNKKWGMQHASWEALLQSTESPDEFKAKEDLLAFYEKIAMTYFRTVREELKRIAPHQNYLGCRFAWNNNDITLTAAAKYCDIVSFNKYEYSVENIGMPIGIDHPIMIGEFHFGALDRGMFHIGVRGADSQEDRGIKYQQYIQGALRNPLIVGAHWFQYTDQPITGRGDGENYNVGLVDVCNNPYPELIHKIKETCYNMYTYRSSHSTQKK